MVDKKSKAEKGLTFEELEAQVGGLLPDRLEMRRRRRRRGRGGAAIAVSQACAGSLCA